ncbi:hypothetical protein PSACC_02489 [Paramicrosporidium saccamoebae]|uniref:C3H1-type domain-containing protein n=1 Tax=Paramicrosporidium saccamoebae TaxID=1246581 RepID=A0A2H9TIW3_9FUNG|nr:hypothetical protein PSACC_02489 [Paramicrosporidium saccamoebae]
MNWSRLDPAAAYKDDLQFDLEQPPAKTSSLSMATYKSMFLFDPVDELARPTTKELSISDGIAPSAPVAISNRRCLDRIQTDCANGNGSVDVHGCVHGCVDNGCTNDCYADHPPGFPGWVGKPTSKSLADKRVVLYKTEICRTFEETGACKYGIKCQFAHHHNELRPAPRHPRYKTEICKTYWERGTCPYGKRCCFIHNESLSDVKSSTSLSSIPINSASTLRGFEMSMSKESIPFSASPARESRLLSRLEKLSTSPVFGLSESWSDSKLRPSSHLSRDQTSCLHGDDAFMDDLQRQQHLSEDILRLVDE